MKKSLPKLSFGNRGKREHGFPHPARWSSRPYRYQGRDTRVCDWRGDGELIWGATARILLNLLALLDQHPIPGDRHATCLD